MFQNVLETFHIENLTQVQKDVLQNLVSRKDVYLSIKTGGGKCTSLPMFPLDSKVAVDWLSINNIYGNTRFKHLRNAAFFIQSTNVASADVGVLWFSRMHFIRNVCNQLNTNIDRRRRH